jgi:predicted anti-sigma-YlaC factor YlaD
MRCPTAHRLIGEYLDKTLRSKDQARLQKHLDSCPDCRSLLKDFQDIAEQAQALDAFSPSDDSWPKILSRVQAAKREKRLYQPRQAGWRDSVGYPNRTKWVWTAALILVVVIGGVVIGIGTRHGKTVPGLGEQDKYTLAKLEEAEKHYQLAIQALNEAVASQKGSLDPQIAAVFDKNLKLINDSIQACMNAVRMDPNSLDARAYLLAAYKEKVDFLDDIMDLKKKSPTGNGSGKTL